MFMPLNSSYKIDQIINSHPCPKRMTPEAVFSEIQFGLSCHHHQISLLNVPADSGDSTKKEDNWAIQVYSTDKVLERRKLQIKGSNLATEEGCC